MWSKIIGSIIGPLFGVIDKSITDKDAAAALKADIHMKLLSLSGAETQAATSVLLAEIGGESWLQRNWRPILMLSIVAIVVNNYILYPYLSLFGVPTVVLELPSELFNLMTVGVGGYIVGRSGEKIMKSYVSKNNG